MLIEKLLTMKEGDPIYDNRTKEKYSFESYDPVYPIVMVKDNNGNIRELYFNRISLTPIK